MAISDILLAQLEQCVPLEWRNDPPSSPKEEEKKTAMFARTDSLVEAIVAPSYQATAYGLSDADDKAVSWARAHTDTIYGEALVARQQDIQCSLLPRVSRVHLMFPEHCSAVQYRFGRAYYDLRPYAAALALGCMDQCNADAWTIRVVQVDSRFDQAFSFSRTEATEKVRGIVDAYVAKTDHKPSVCAFCAKCAKLVSCEVANNAAKDTLLDATDEITFDQALKSPRRINAFLMGARLVRKYETIAKDYVKEKELELDNFTVLYGRFNFKTTKK